MRVDRNSRETQIEIRDVRRGERGVRLIEVDSSDYTETEDPSAVDQVRISEQGRPQNVGEGDESNLSGVAALGGVTKTLRRRRSVDRIA